jgi:hypothetical protein
MSTGVFSRLGRRRFIASPDARISRFHFSNAETRFEWTETGSKLAKSQQKVVTVTGAARRLSNGHDFSPEAQRKAVLDFLNGGFDARQKKGAASEEALIGNSSRSPFDRLERE